MALAEALPEELVFRVNYLGGDMPTFALNFSRPGAQVAAQYYTFLRLAGTASAPYSRRPATWPGSLADRIEATGRLPPAHPRRPVAGLRLHDRDRTSPRYDVFDVSRRMRERGWLVPAYTFPPNREDLSVLRVVCRNGFSADLADLFLET